MNYRCRISSLSDGPCTICQKRLPADKESLSWEITRYQKMNSSSDRIMADKLKGVGEEAVRTWKVMKKFPGPNNLIKLMDLITEHEMNWAPGLCPLRQELGCPNCPVGYVKDVKCEEVEQ